MKFLCLVLSFAIMVPVKGQPPISNTTTPPLDVQITLTSETLGEGTVFDVTKLDHWVVVTVSAAESVDVKRILPGILTEIVVQEISDGLNSSAFHDGYVSFYRKLGNLLTYDDLFGYHSDQPAFLERVLRKFDVAAGPPASDDPLTKEYSTIRQLLRKVLSAEELVGPYNGLFLHSLHEKSRQIVSQVLGEKPETRVLSDALVVVEIAVERAQYGIVKLLDILRKFKVEGRPSHRSTEYERKSSYYRKSNNL